VKVQVFLLNFTIERLINIKVVIDEIDQKSYLISVLLLEDEEKSYVFNI